MFAKAAKAPKHTKAPELSRISAPAVMSRLQAEYTMNTLVLLTYLSVFAKRKAAKAPKHPKHPSQAKSVHRPWYHTSRLNINNTDAEPQAHKAGRLPGML